MTTRFGPPYSVGTNLLGVNSLGVIGSLVPLTGDDGGALLANDPFISTDEVRVKILTIPPGDMQVFEDSSFIYTGPGGSGTYEFYKNGVLIDTYTFTIVIGTAPYPSEKGYITTKYNKLVALGYSGALQEMFLDFLVARGATSKTLNQAEKEFLLSKSMANKTLNDMWFKYLGDLGYTGTLVEREAVYWNSVV